LLLPHAVLLFFVADGNSYSPLSFSVEQVVISDLP
jgi:hypothetical protein